MISQNDLYDISYALMCIRNDIQNKNNCIILNKIISILEIDEINFEDNQIRKALSSIEGLDEKVWNYIYNNNVYVRHKILKDRKIYELLIKFCKETVIALKCKKIEQAIDLVDCFHCLPDIIADNNFLVPKSYWKIYLKRYRNKWCKDFMILEEKKIKKQRVFFL